MSRLDLTKTYSLEGLADGFDENTYLKFEPLSNDYSNEVRGKLDRLRKNDEEGTLAVMNEALRHAFKGGRVYIASECQVVDAEIDDLEALGKTVVIDIFSVITQSKFVSPKGMATAN